jgi:hypothetical protein
VGFLNTLMPLHIWLAAGTQLADKEFLQVAVKKGGVSKITRKN